MNQSDRLFFRGIALIVVIYTVLVGGIYLLTGEPKVVPVEIEAAAKRMIQEDMIRP